MIIMWRKKTLEKTRISRNFSRCQDVEFIQALLDQSYKYKLINMNIDCFFKIVKVRMAIIINF